VPSDTRTHPACRRLFHADPADALSCVLNCSLQVLTAPEMVSREVVSLSFSSDDSMLLVQGGGPDWLLSCWLWEKGKVGPGCWVVCMPVCMCVCLRAFAVPV
jgi:hypothetical protein